MAYSVTLDELPSLDTKGESRIIFFRLIVYNGYQTDKTR